MILEKNRKYKKIIKDTLSESNKIKFRRITDDKGDLADTLIFNLENKTLAYKFVEKLNSIGLITKNLPDAIDWHFSGTWNQMFFDVPEYKNKWNTQWKKSDDLLRRSISLPIFIKKTEKEIINESKAILKILNSI